MSFSRHFRDNLQSMSYASRSHRGRFRRMTVAFFLYFPFAKVMAFLSTFCDILPHSPQSPLKFLPPSGYPKVNPERPSNGNQIAPPRANQDLSVCYGEKEKRRYMSPSIPQLLPHRVPKINGCFILGERRYMSPNDARHQSLRPCYRTRRVL